MRACRSIAGLALVFVTTFTVAQTSKFNWDWRNQEVIGREDPSVGNTSKLTESERSSLIDAIVLRLQKPMGDAGYDDDRIREIATTTRIRFIDVGAGQPLILATSIGLEGGCDALANCPLWVFRRTDDGFLSLLNTIAASFTAEPTEAGFEVVFMHHVSAKESGLAVYHFADEKLQAVSCYRALWPKPSNDPDQLSDPKIEPCKQPPLLESAQPVKPEAPQPAAAEPVPTQPAAEKPEAQPTPDTMEPKEQASPATEQPAAQPKQDTTEQAPPAKETPKADQPQSAPDQPAPAPTDQAQPQQPSLPDQPAPDAKQDVPKADEARRPAEQQTPDAKQDAPKPDQAPPQQPSQQTPDAGQQAPDDKQAQPPKPDQPAQEAPPANPEPAPAPDSKPAPPSSSPDQAQPDPIR